MNHHNLHRDHGRSKGQFVSTKVHKWRNNVRVSRKKKVVESEDMPGTSDCSGRRVVEFSTLAHDLWCNVCNRPLSLRNIENEQRFGLACRLDVLCSQCNANYTVETNKRQANHLLYDVNSKAAIALIDAGIGEAQLNAVLSALNIPVLSSTMIKRYERLVGRAIETVAENSCQDGVKIEKMMTVAASHGTSAQQSDFRESSDLENVQMPSPKNRIADDPEEPVSIVASFDAGWQKRGTGRAYNSLSGHSSLIGHRSKKILGYAVRSKACAMCARGHTRNDHDCRKNYEGSAKSMEPDMAVQLVVNNNLLKNENVRVSVLIGDDDSSTIAAVRRESSSKIDKWSDLNHASKALNNALYGLHIPTKIIGYLSRSFSCALKQNQDDPAAVASAIRNIVCHAYGEHDNCGDWCGYHTLREKYEHKGLPKGQPLKDPGLRDSLTSIFARFAQNSEKLAPCASSQGNESFNHTVSSKAPKSKFYAGSESLNFRVAASVAQKNIGVNYIEDVNKILKLSPSSITKEFRNKKENIRRSKVKKSRTVEIKKRRLFHKNERSTKGASAQRREGITYETESQLTCVSELIDELPVSLDTSQESTDFHDTAIVFFDLETTGLSNKAEICQIAATHYTQEFNVYMVPLKGISASAAAVTGLQVSGGEMYLHDARVNTTPPRMALNNFIVYLRSIGECVILVAHNGFRFDAPIILRCMREYGLLEEFRSIVKGFSDTLILFRDHLPDRKKDKKGYSQTALAEDLLGCNAAEGAHNAVNDVSILSRLVSSSGISENLIRSKAKSTSVILHEEKVAVIHARNRESLEAMKETVSAGMRGKMSKAGITMQVLEKAYADCGAEGIRILLGEDVRGKPRVTKNKKILTAVVTHVEKIKIH